jgi:putative ABC transport system permease protein
LSALKQACARLVSLFQRDALDGEFDEEAQLHLDLAMEDYVQRGMPEAEARRLARIKFGGVEASKDAHRDSRGLAWFEGVLNDLHFALRGLRRDRAFTVTSVATLALAIGLNVTVFAVMNAMLFRGFPLVKRNDRLVYMQERYPSQICCMSYPDFEDWRAQAKSFEGIAFIAAKQITFSEGDERALDTPTTTTSVNAFGLLGVRPLLGRDFAPADEKPGAPPVAILSYRFWALRFDKRAEIVGHKVRIDNVPATVIGVMPEGFDFPMQRNLWMPLVHSAELQHRGPGGYLAVGRLAEGVTVAGARAELETINRRLAAAYPATNRDVVPRVETYSQFFIGPNAPVIYGSLWAAAWFVLLIACANLANLTLARTLGRSREFSTRMALGAGHWRMVRQTFAESVLLASVGGALGWWIAKWSVRTWATATESLYQILDYSLDYRTFTYLIAISIAAALLFGLVPIGRARQLDVNGILKGDARGATQGFRGKYFSAVLVAGQMTLAVVLLSGAGILVRSLSNIVNAEAGVSAPEKVLIGSVAVRRVKFSSPESRVAFFDRLKLRLLAIPGVESVSMASTVPPTGPGSIPFELEAQPVGGRGRPAVMTVASAPDYFRIVGATAVAGRDFTDADQPATLPVAIVNQSFVAKYWPGQDPLGKRLRMVRQDKPDEWRTIVGVVSNIMTGDPTRQTFKPVVYVPYRQQPFATMFFLARTGPPPMQLAAAIRADVEKLDTDLTLGNFSTLKASFAFRADWMDLEHVELGKYAAVAPIFAVIALLLAVVGLYAVVAHSVRQRTKEIGVRIAIGATTGDIRRLIFREGMLPVAAGLILGLTLSLAVNRILQSQLVGVSPYDPVTLAAAPILLILVALLACEIPSRRAVHVDPAVALRHD